MFNQNQKEAIMKLKNITMEHFMKRNRKLMKIMKDVVEKKDEYLDGKKEAAELLKVPAHNRFESNNMNNMNPDSYLDDSYLDD